MPPTFQTIPLELRRKVYDYLLLDQNVCYTKVDKRMQSRYCTSLFTVSQQISMESLDYFYTQNVFVGIQSNLGYFLDFCHRGIPIIIGESVRNTRRWKKHMLEINLHIRLTTGGKGSGVRNENIPAVFAARHLPNFVHFLNGEHSTLRSTSNQTQLTLEYRTAGQYSSSSGVNKMVEGIKGIRDIPDGSGMRLRVVGDLDEERKNEIRAATSLPDLTHKETLAIGTKLKDQGNAFYKMGDYTAARGKYITAACLVSNLDQDYEAEDMLDFQSLIISLHTNTSLVETRQGDHKAAARKARQAWEFTIQRPADNSTAAQKAKLKYRLGSALADDHQYDEAVKHLDDAVKFAPENVGMKGKLSTVTQLASRHQSQSAAEFRNNLSAAFS